MPEGHTLHRAARDARERLVGDPLAVSSPQGRFRDGARAFDGLRLDAAEAWGKNLLLTFENDASIRIHLGLQGRFLWFGAEARGKANVSPRSVRLRLSGPRAGLDVVAPLVCERLDAAERDALLEKLGPDPLRADADPERAWHALKKSRRSLGALLLDQSVFAGVGNVFRAEALFLLGLHPDIPAASLDRPAFDALWATLTRLMARAVDEERILPVDTPPDIDRASLPQEALRHVYKQERCRRCGAPVEQEEIGGRTSYACPHCQPRVSP